jgi:hypothetical protein
LAGAVSHRDLTGGGGGGEGDIGDDDGTSIVVTVGTILEGPASGIGAFCRGLGLGREGGPIGSPVASGVTRDGGLGCLGGGMGCDKGMTGGNLDLGIKRPLGCGRGGRVDPEGLASCSAIGGSPAFGWRSSNSSMTRSCWSTKSEARLVVGSFQARMNLYKNEWEGNAACCSGVPFRHANNVACNCVSVESGRKK